MSEKFFGAKSKFVYYNNLEEYRPDMYRKIIAEKTYQIKNHDSKMKSIAEDMLRFAAIEAKKEVGLLKKFFNINDLSFDENDLYNSSVGVDIVKAINTTLQFQDVYKRHVDRIVGRNGKKHAKITSAQFFADYFSKNFQLKVEQTLDQLGDSIYDYTPYELGEILFSDKNIEEALSDTFFKSLKESGDWSKKDEAHGYKELFEAIEGFNKNSLLEEVSQAYHLEDLKQRLMETVTSSQQMKDIFSNKRKSKSYIKKSLKESTTAKGTLAEIMGEKGTSAVISSLQAAGFDIDYSAKVVGKAGGKADIVMSFGLDMSSILDVVDQHYNGRVETVEAYKTLGDYLSKAKDGYIVYTNAKDYSLIDDVGQKGYSFQGFSAGSAISLDTLEGVINNTPGGSAELIGSIMSTMEGAILSDRIEELESELCSKMAYLLFDDVLTIGKNTKAGSHAIHLLLLDGIYIPLSYLLFLMSRAITEVAEDPRDIFNITISPGEIAFPNPPWQPGDWTRQKNEAYDQIKIKATFLKSFRQIISQLK